MFFLPLFITTSYCAPCSMDDSQPQASQAPQNQSFEAQQAQYLSLGVEPTQPQTTQIPQYSVYGSQSDFPALSPFPFKGTGNWIKGSATHYGPYPNFPSFNEVGYLDGEVGVGCSTGSNDTEWQAILALGRIPNPLNPKTVWPKVPTVAVSQSMWKREEICWKTIILRNSASNVTVTAVVVDFCPTEGCLWSKSELDKTVDLYGQETWMLLGGDKLGGAGHISIDIQWPEGVTPNK